MDKNIIAFGLLTKLKLKKIWSFKANLISQAVGMMVNNLALLSIWWLLFARFGSINGYTFKEILLIEGFVGVMYAWFHFLIGGVLKLSEFINQDKFLDLQLYPLNPLTVLMTKSGDASQFGDFIEGVILISIYLFLNPSGWWLILICLILSTVGMFGVVLFFNSLLFFIPGALNIFSDLIENVYIGASMYPSNNFSGAIRYVLYFLLLIPIVSIPMETIRGTTHPSFLIYTVLAVVSINVAGYWLWSKGVKKVESGSSGGIVE